jgi:hypothetical protein
MLRERELISESDLSFFNYEFSRVYNNKYVQEYLKYLDSLSGKAKPIFPSFKKIGKRIFE